jgi:hypothetical protein
MLLGVVAWSLAAIAHPMVQSPGNDTTCTVMNATPAELKRRASPLDSLSFTVRHAAVKICYGRPSSRGRVMIGGGHVPYGKLWRTGANEPTTITISSPLTLAGLPLPAGRYSLYSIPDSVHWTLILNRSTAQWGEESTYTAEIRSLEVGRVLLPVTHPDSTIEQFTILAEPHDRKTVHLILEWETTRVVVPVEAVGW